MSQTIEEYRNGYTGGNHPKFTKNYFIAKFEAIPESEIGTSINDRDPLFHCGCENITRPTEEAKALSDLLRYWFWLRNIRTKSVEPVWKINDGRTQWFRQATPKQRILAALRQIP